jgi:hypothetical protein
MREECRLRMFRNRVLRGIFVPKRDENNEMGQTCNTYGGEEGRIRGFGGET